MQRIPDAIHKCTYAEYVAAEERANEKHEWFNGEIFAMSGGTPTHAMIAAAIIGILYGQLLGKPCRPYSTDLRIRVKKTGLATYPDLSVICGDLELDPEDRCAVTNPTVLVEVLSDSTERYDRSVKFLHYASIPSLKTYVLVSQHQKLITVFTRNETEMFDDKVFASGEVAELASIGCTLDVDAVYSGVPLPQ